jgi:signal transduction protein with GAF and PtsI domain
MQDKRFAKLADFGRELLTKASLEDGLPLISKYVKDVVGADRCSIFIYNAKEHRLWTTIAEGVERIEVDVQEGVVGHTIRTQEPIITNDAYAHPHFLPKIDKETGYKTHNLITAPIFDSKRIIIGVLELLNKEGGFNEEDVKFMKFFAHYISGFLELVSIYEKV